MPMSKCSSPVSQGSFSLQQMVTAIGNNPWSKYREQAIMGWSAPLINLQQDFCTKCSENTGEKKAARKRKIWKPRKSAARLLVMTGKQGSWLIPQQTA